MIKKTILSLFVASILFFAGHQNIFAATPVLFDLSEGLMGNFLGGDLEMVSNGDLLRLELVESEYNLFRSTDEGLTWATTTLPGSVDFAGITSSNDGQTIAVTDQSGFIYISSNGGTTWATSTNTGLRYFKIDSSSDGEKLVSAVLGGYIYVSSNGGSTWATSTSAGDRFWRALAMSADGERIVAGANASDLYLSIDGGDTWNSTTAGVDDWTGATMSADGQTIAAVSSDRGCESMCSEGSVYLSSDGGTTWATSSSAGISFWASVEASSDGESLVATHGDESKKQLFFSDDSGDTWSSSTIPFSYAAGPVAISADGKDIYFGESDKFYRGIIDETNPSISNISTSNASSTFSISFDADEETSAIMIYGVGSATSSVSSSEDTEHSFSLVDLIPCTEYEYRITVTDVVENETDETSTFVTEGCLSDMTPSMSDSVNVPKVSGDSFSVSSATVIVPPDYASTTSSFQISKLSGTSTLPENRLMIGDAYRVSAFTSPTSTLNVLDASMNIILSYDGLDISGVDDESITVYVATSSSWQALSSCSLNTGSEIVTCQTSSLPAYFALVGTELVAEEESSGGGGGGGKSSSRRSVDTAASLSTTTSSPAVPGATPSSSSFSRDLQVGDSGTDVQALQKFLNAQGFIVAATGPGSVGNETNLFGGGTRAALSKFQASKGLPATGYFGPLTRGLILGVSAPAAPVPAPASTTVPSSVTFSRDLSLGSQGDDVKALQDFLESKGFFVIPVGIAKGYFGSLTQQALIKFQAANGISPASGYFGPVTKGFVER